MKPLPARLSSPQLDDKVIELWTAGHTAQAIANVIGLSRNAIVSRVAKLRRYGYNLQGRTAHSTSQTIAAHAPPRSSPRRSKPACLPPTPAEEPLPAPVEASPKTILQLLTGDCRYIISGDDERPTYFCAIEAIAGKSYCVEHYNICCTIRHNLTPADYAALALAERLRRRRRK
jgi:hypothetical protein